MQTIKNRNIKIDFNFVGEYDEQRIEKVCFNGDNSEYIVRYGAAIPAV